MVMLYQETESAPKLSKKERRKRLEIEQDIYKEQHLVTVEMDALTAMTVAPEAYRAVKESSPTKAEGNLPDVVELMWVLTTRCVRGRWEYTIETVGAAYKYGDNMVLPDEVFTRMRDDRKSINTRRKRRAAERAAEERAAAKAAA